MTTYEQMLKQRREDRAAEKLRKKTTINKARKGFPVMLRSGDIMLMQMAFAWLKVREKTEPQMDEAIKLFLDTDPATMTHFTKTTRIRGDQVQGVIALFEATRLFPGLGNLYQRLDDLKKITTMDAIADASR